MIYVLFGVVIVIAVLVIAMFIIFIITGVPFVSLSKKKIDKILDFIEFDKTKTLYDLGCGDARFLVRSYAKYGISGVGYELNWWAILRFKLNIFIHRSDVVLFNKNFLKVNLASADYIFVYLIPSAMVQLENKLLKEPKDFREVISYGFAFPNLKPSKVFYTESRRDRGRVYIYNL